MKHEEYLEALARMSLAASSIRDLDLAGAIRAAERADILGPVLDPTLWMKAGDKNLRILEALRAAQRFVTTVDAICQKEVAG